MRTPDVRARTPPRARHRVTSLVRGSAADKARGRRPSLLGKYQRRLRSVAEKVVLVEFRQGVAGKDAYVLRGAGEVELVAGVGRGGGEEIFGTWARSWWDSTRDSRHSRASASMASRELARGEEILVKVGPQRPGRRRSTAAHARIRAIGERANATSKTWQVLTKLRCRPRRATAIVHSILVLHHLENPVHRS